MIKVINQNKLHIIKDWLRTDTVGKAWVIAGEMAFLFSSYAAANLVAKPILSYYAESSYLGDFATDCIIGILISYVLIYLLFPKFKKSLQKRYIVTIKILLVPIVGLIILLLNIKPFYKETIHDLPRGVSK